MLLSRYAPRRPVRLEATTVRSDEALLAFGPAVPLSAAETLNLSPAGDLKEAAARLFAYLHRLDSLAVSAIAVMPIPAEGLGAAINDRLRRAAAPREVTNKRPQWAAPRRTGPAPGRTGGGMGRRG